MNKKTIIIIQKIIKNRYFKFSILSVLFIFYLLLLRYNFINFNIFKLILSLFLFFILPGNIILNFIYREKDIAKNIVLSCVLGIGFNLVLFVLCALFKIQNFQIFIIILLSLIFALKNKIYFGNVYHPGYVSILILIYIFFFILLTLRNQVGAQFTPDGSLQLSYYSDTFFHNGILQSISKNFPPYFQSISNYKYYNYHFGLDIFALLLTKYSGINSIIILTKYTVLINLFLIIFSSFYFAEQLFKNRYYAVLFVILIFSSDLGYLIPICSKYGANCLKTPTIYSLTMLNPQSLALIFSFVFLYFYVRWNNNLKKILILLFLIPVILETKFFMGIQLVFGLVISSIYLYFKRKNKNELYFILLILLSLIPSVLKMLFLLKRSNYVLKLCHLCIYQDIIKNLHLNNIPLILTILLFFGLIILQFGPRIIFFFGAARAKFSPRINIFFISFILLGITMTFFFRYAPKDQMTYDNIVWFMVNSLIFMWVYVVEFIQNNFKNKIIKILIIILLIISSYPSTMKHFNIHKKNILIKKEYLEAGKYLVNNSNKEKIAIEQINHNKELSIIADSLGGTQTVFSDSNHFLYTFITKKEINMRKSDVNNFFRTLNRVTMQNIIDKYHINIIIYYGKNNNINYLFDQLGFQKKFQNEFVTIYQDK